MHIINIILLVHEGLESNRNLVRSLQLNRCLLLRNHFFFGRVVVLENVVNLVSLFLLTAQMLDHIRLRLHTEAGYLGSLIEVNFIELDNLLLALELILKLHLQLLLKLDLLLLMQSQLFYFINQLFGCNYVVIYVLLMLGQVVSSLKVMVYVGTMYPIAWFWLIVLG